MLSKQNRVSKELFDELLKKGKVLHSPLFSLRYIDENITISRFAFVVSKKIAPNAADRNKLRRRGYSAVRPFFPFKKSIIASFFFKKGAKGVKFGEIKKEIEGLLKRAGAI